MAIGGTKVVQVTNIAPQATKDQMQTLFGYLGKIEDIRLYPTIRDVSCPVQSRICYIKFMESATVGVSQHMTNTVFIDRALIVIPIPSGDIPDEYFALEMTRNGTIVPGLHASEPNLPPNVINSVVTLSTGQAIVTYDPKLEANGLTPYPPLPSNYDTRKIEEIRRTVIMVDVDPLMTSDDYIELFTPAGEVKYLRQCTRTSDDQTHMLIEFTDQPSIKEVLKMNGLVFNGKPIKIIHSTQAIIKPQAKSNEAAQREIEEAMTRVKEAQNLISATIDPVIGMLSKDKRRRSRSRSRGRHRRSRSRSRRRSRSRHRSKRSRSKSRKRSKSRDRKHRSKSPARKRSRSRSRRSRSQTTKTPKSRSKSRSKSSRRERTTYNKSKERAKSKDRSKEVERAKVSREKERVKSSKDRERSCGRSKAKSKDKERESHDSKDRRSDMESTAETEDKRSSRKVARSPSRTKYRSRSRERKRTKSRDRRSRSRGRRRTPSPRKVIKRRSRTRSRDRKRDKRDRRERTPSLPKSVRNYDEEERGYDERNRRKVYSDSYDTDHQRDKDSDAKSDNMDISNSP